MMVLLMTFVFAVPSGSAMYIKPEVYSSFDNFQKGSDILICQKVTDGCNEWYLSDGNLGNPIKSCKLTLNFKYQWSCTQFSDPATYLVGQTPSFIVEAKFSQEQEDLYDMLQDNLSYEYEQRVNEVLVRYYNRREDYKIFSQERYTVFVEDMVDTYILKTTLKYSENGELSSK